MPDKLPMGTVNPQFRGLEARLFTTNGTWWLEITPVPTRADERLRRPWRSLFRVPFLAIDGPLTFKAFTDRMAVLIATAADEPYPALEPVTSR